MQETTLLTLVTLQASPPDAEAYSFWALVANAPSEVQALVVILALMSLGSWFIVGAKAVRVIQAGRQSRRFLDQFWAEGQGDWGAERLEAIYAGIKSVGGSPLAKVFHAGYVELARLTKDTAPAGEAPLENVDRALSRTTSAEMTRLESLLPFLATTGSTAPFIGLLGTVLGILDVFHRLGGGGAATLDVIGPKIAEALFVTAIGLFAAIPAVMAYNYFVRRIRVIESEAQAFANDYLNIVRRHFL